MQMIKTVNPATEEIGGIYRLMDQAQVEIRIQETSLVQQKWAETDFKTRKQHLLQMAQSLIDDKILLATSITQEMGKPLSQSIAEIEKCALLCEFYAQNGEDFLKSERIEAQFYKSYRSFHPLGTIFAIMPWNFPVWQVMRFAIPNLMAGNAGILKHAPNCFGTALLIEALFLKAGFPKRLFCNVIVDVDCVPFIIRHPKIAGVTFTGSNRAGRLVAQEAGSALKKVVLELGGNDPYVILKDADLDFAAEQCVISRLNNCGQVCIAAKRLIVVKDVLDEFQKRVIEKAQQYTYGNPLDRNTKMGPMAREDLRNHLHQQVQESIQQGARCVLGGSLPDTVGYYYPTTILLDVKPPSTAFEEELFGPVICIIPADDEAHAMLLANQSDFGLAGSIFTGDLIQGEYLANQVLAAGTCAVNSLVSSNPRLPFGGIKQSGYGRELSVEGIREFVNIKTVIVAKPT